ncbi:PucR family transcriptional regulator [Cryptosporangium sp. NPDC051539]|uniref:PucR family transcriptional regulator n=1 Tax=Cryptosporangium sp. NPDC051539 TaxID=3363962 RepID=UPI0037A37665
MRPLSPTDSQVTVQTWHASPVTTAPLAATLRRIERASGALATRSVARMDDTLPWFRSLPADQRSWVTLVVQAGIGSLVQWMRSPKSRPKVTGDVFGAAPREMARSVTLQQALAMVKITVEVAEEQAGELAAPGEESELREAILRYSREVAFATAEVYARAAETRGAWDLRLQALLVDALLRGDPADALASRAAALGWTDLSPVAVVIGTAPNSATVTVMDSDQIVDSLVHTGRRAGLDVLAGVQGQRLVAVLGGADDPVRATQMLLPEFGTGPIVVGHAVPALSGAPESARAAEAGWRAVAAWPAAPRPVAAADLLPERVLAGDTEARRRLVSDVYKPLDSAGPTLVETLSVYLDSGGALEATARILFVHPNTVRYRLRRIGEITTLVPTNPRDAFSLRLALAIGRMHGQT